MTLIDNFDVTLGAPANRYVAFRCIKIRRSINDAQRRRLKKMIAFAGFHVVKIFRTKKPAGVTGRQETDAHAAFFQVLDERTG